tara:strand:- start:679 stop:834 length:156 start_codon:yes stop_codon:yes gene_type:complete
MGICIIKIVNFSEFYRLKYSFIDKLLTLLNESIDRAGQAISGGSGITESKI